MMTVRSDLPTLMKVERDDEKVTSYVHLAEPKFECTFISTGKTTKNLFNALGIGNFKKIKNEVKFLFQNIFGDMGKINELCESSEDLAKIEFSNNFFEVREGEIRLKLETYYDDDEEHRDIDGEDNPQELAFLIDILPS